MLTGSVYEQIRQKLARGETVLLDGGTGTELERCGAAMDSDVWCATANLTHPEIVKQVHAEYIRAGAEVITANTYASSPLSFSSFGRADEIVDIDAAAMRHARDAVRETADGPIAIAGSFSVMRPLKAGQDRTEFDERWTHENVMPVMQRKADNLSECGADLLIMEMLRDIEQSLWATEAAVATGLPVWVGISVERREDGKLAGFSDHRWTLEEMVTALMATGAEACLVMHHNIDLTDEALKTISSLWAGTVGAYPESGVFKMPKWEFGEISPEEFAQHCRRWQGMGAGIVGGCCGITPEHIRAVSDEFGGKAA